MIRLEVLVFLLTVGVFCDGEDCVTVDFEEGFELFEPVGMCATLSAPGEWSLGFYHDTDVEPPHELSSTFVQPSDSMSCISSPTFRMSVDGTFEINIFMVSNSSLDQVNVFLNQIIVGGNDAQVEHLMLLPQLPGFTEGWNKLEVTIGGNTPYFDGYVTLIGAAADGSSVLVDSFRYIEPSEDGVEDPDLSCPIYQETATEATTAPTEPTPGATTNSKGFWNPFTITMVVIISLLIVIILCLVCYEIGKSKTNDNAQLIYDDMGSELPRSVIVPRVTGVSSKSNLSLHL